MLQVDGNVTIEDVKDDSIEMSESQIYEHDRELLLSAYTFDSVDSITSNQQTSSHRTANFSLNKDKQIGGLIADANLNDFSINVNDSDKNVNIHCSTAFYDKVAKPVMCGLSMDTTLNFGNISISCLHIDHNRDSKGYEYNRVLHIKVGGSGKFSIGKITIHLHHSKRHIQMQGSALMPDGNRAPVWFLNNFVKERFTRLAKLKHYDITALNSAIKKTVENEKNVGNLSNNCSQCSKLFSSSSRPTKCIYCHQYFHKTGCLPSHSSSCQQKLNRTTAITTTTQASTHSATNQAREGELIARLSLQA